jgi:hypothetical protein
MTYTYTLVSESPDLDFIHIQVASSLMVDKQIDYCRYDEDLCLLQVIFINELSVEDKAILDQIVTQLPI